MDGCSIHVEGGPLWQWDVGRELHVLDYEPGDVVDFAQAGHCDSLMVAIGEGGVAPIPNQLLKRPDGIRAWQRRDGETLAAVALSVRARAKPSDYEYVATPTVGYGELSEEMDRRFKAIEELVGRGGLTEVREPLVLEGGVLSLDLSKVGRGTQVTVGDGAPEGVAMLGDSYISTDGTLYEYAETEMDS